MVASFPSPPGIQAPFIITGRGNINLASDGYCGPDGTDMLAGWNRAVADVQSAGRGQGIKITSGAWTTSRTLEVGLGLARVMVDGHEGQTTISSSTATVPFTLTASQSGTTLTVTANPSGGRIGVGTNVRPPGWNATPPTAVCFTIVAPGASAGQWAVTVSQTVASGTMTANNPLMLVGGNTALAGAIHGHVHGLRLFGASSAPNDLSTALTVASYTSFRLHHLEVANTDIGIDAINNTFALDLDQIWAGSGGVCNVGLNIRGGGEGGAGNQIKIDNGWLTGAKYGVLVAPGCDGVAINQGQIGCTGTSAIVDDLRGCLGWGKDYVTGVTGGTGAIKVDTSDFEGSSGWIWRGFGQVPITFLTNSIVEYGPGIGVLKITDGMNESVTMIGNTFSNSHFSGASAIVRDGAFYAGQYYEQGSKTDNLTFNGVTVADQQPLVMQSGLTNATAFYTSYAKGPSVYAVGKSVPIASLAQTPTINAASDSAAATAGVAIGSLYRNGSAVQVRVA